MEFIDEESDRRKIPIFQSEEPCEHTWERYCTVCSNAGHVSYGTNLCYCPEYSQVNRCTKCGEQKGRSE